RRSPRNPQRTPPRASWGQPEPGRAGAPHLFESMTSALPLVLRLPSREDAPWSPHPQSPPFLKDDATGGTQPPTPRPGHAPLPTPGAVNDPSSSYEFTFACAVLTPPDGSGSMPRRSICSTPVGTP